MGQIHAICPIKLIYPIYHNADCVILDTFHLLDAFHRPQSLD